MYMKSYVYIVAWLILIVVSGCEVRIVLFTQMMAVVKRYLSKYSCQSELAYQGDEGGDQL